MFKKKLILLLLIIASVFLTGCRMTNDNIIEQTEKCTKASMGAELEYSNIRQSGHITGVHCTPLN